MAFITPNDLRARFAASLSDMYQQEVPLYGDLLSLVADINAKHDKHLSQPEKARLRAERHGAIRLGTPAELRLVSRMFGLMGMQAVGYYDLTVAGLPMHACAFRPLDTADLLFNPFRVFCSIIRMDLLEQDAREMALRLLQARQIMSDSMKELLRKSEEQGGVLESDTGSYIAGAIDVFRWHLKTTTNFEDYSFLAKSSPLLADVCCFPGPHINHLTPSTLNIDAAQHEMEARGIPAKQVIEGPPKRLNPILLRQTSFQAISEPIIFVDHDHESSGKHRARFGEIEERGAALTPKGKRLYEELLFAARADAASQAAPKEGDAYLKHLAQHFAPFPDDLVEMVKQKLMYAQYEVVRQPLSDAESQMNLFELLKRQMVRCKPLIYEDFLPASAAGIFTSNLGTDQSALKQGNPDRQAFEESLGHISHDEVTLYARQQEESLEQVSRVYPRVVLG